LGNPSLSLRHSPEVVAIGADVVVVVSQDSGMLGVIQGSGTDRGNQNKGANGQDTDAGGLHVCFDFLFKTFQEVLRYIWTLGLDCTLR